MSDFMEMLRANGGKTWAELHPISNATYRVFPPFEPEELTIDQQYARLESIRARPIIQIGMSVAELLHRLKESKRFSGLELQLIADRCFITNAPLSDALKSKLWRGGIFDSSEVESVKERLSLL